MLRHIGKVFIEFFFVFIQPRLNYARHFQGAAPCCFLGTRRSLTVNRVTERKMFVGQFLNNLAPTVVFASVDSVISVFVVYVGLAFHLNNSPEPFPDIR